MPDNTPDKTPSNRLVLRLEDEAVAWKKDNQRRLIEEETLQKVSRLELKDLSTIQVHLKDQALRHDCPSNARELHGCIKILFGIYVPWVATTPDANAPFEWISNVFFGKSPLSFAIGARNSGKTHGASMLHYLLNTFKPGYMSRHAGANREQASVAAAYLRLFASDTSLGSVFDKQKVGKSEATWKNLSNYKILTGSTAGVSGNHPVAAFWDEIEFWKVEALEQSWYVPSSYGRYDKLWVAMSTRQRCLPGYTRIITEDGLQKISRIVNTRYAGKVKSFNVTTGTWEWKAVTGWFRNGSSTEWYKVYLEYTGKGRGCELIATGDHYVYYDGVHKKPLRDFTVGDTLCVPSTEPYGPVPIEQVPIARIEIVETAPQVCYDITVEDNHNYCNGSNILVSNSFGAANWLGDHAAEKGVDLYRWTAFETMQRCRSCIAIDQHPNGTDDERQSVCNLYEDCLGKRGIKSSGWVPREEVCKIKKSLSKAAWRVQGVCDKPSSSGLVLSNFDHEYRIDGGNYTHFAYQPHLPLYVTHDPAEGKKSCLFFIQLHEGNVYVFDEIIQPECPNTSTTKKAFYEHCRKMGYADPVVIVVDPRKTDAMADWSTGTPSGEGLGKRYKAVGPPTDNARGGQLIAQTIEFLRKQIQDGDGIRRFFVNPKTCPGLVKALREYHYPTDMNNVITSDTPDKEYSDEIDPIRYFIQYHKFVLQTSSHQIHWFVN